MSSRVFSLLCIYNVFGPAASPLFSQAKPRPIAYFFLFGLQRHDDVMTKRAALCLLCGRSVPFFTHFLLWGAVY